MREKEKLRQTLASIKNSICLTSDVWTACTSEGYICLSAHFVDDDWKLNSKILNFAHMPPPHSGVELASKLFGFLKEWRIEKKVLSLTLDNASSNDNMQGILKERLSLHDSMLYDVWKIEVLLNENLSNEDLMVSDMCKRMKEKFDKYWNQYSVVLAFGAILDPRIKLSMLKFFYSKLDDDPIKCQEKMLIVKTKLYKLFQQYSNVNQTSSSQPRSSSVTISHTQSGGEIKNKGKRIYDEIMAYESQTIRNAGKSELDLYLEEPKLEFA
ncbi:zinc finger BED domain-containing protein DAYSLEEPER-like [Primulina huaijiensis]|uniref:zinc finger BED domain-containing protein DAYSLEEPER-like n=1 Tax=Primulina huaijiensis TaxID=1492673 RepID=UPI003CC72C58